MNYLKSFRLFIFILLFYSGLVNAEDKPTAAAIASTNALATRAGKEIIRAGGNAFDAAIAISAVLAVTEPYSSGFGGGGLWLIYRASDGKQVMLDGREKAPELAHRRMYMDEQGHVISAASLIGPLAAGIPGMPAGVAYLAQHYGNLPLTDSLKSAIKYAEKGFKVNQEYRALVGTQKNIILKFPDTARIFLDHDEIPKNGTKLKQKDLARTIRLLAEKGHAGFYSGVFAGNMVHEVNKHGGIWTVKDLADYHVVERTPIVTTYRGMKVVSAPPPSSGGIVLGQALKILAYFDIHSMDGIARKHHIIEAMRRAYRDRAVYLGDPDFVDIPVARLMSDDYLEGLALMLDPEKATPSNVLGNTLGLAQTGLQTTHFSVIDAEGNRVAGTLSINTMFGSGFIPAGTGVLLNNEMDNFSIKKHTSNSNGLTGDEVNSIQPGKRPLSSMTPTFLETKDRVAILGTAGGSRIISMVLLAALDFMEGNPPESWVRLPRFHHQYLPDVVQFERDGLSFEEQRQLHDRGHKLQEYHSTYGNMQAIMWDKKTNKVYASSDPRGEGVAIVFSK